ncbi:uncharacterized protein MYCFIDRAFT_128450, partial [Pseudocercospora fijiensis CIRAD86]
EGSAYDSRILNNARSHYRFDTLEGRYYLADASYLNSAPYIVLYRGVRYYLREQYLAAMRPADYKELFNLRYSSLRNVVERTFSIIKRRFRIFESAPQYSIRA